MNKENITKYLDHCSQLYYIGSPLITDEEFDALAELIGYSKVGAKVTSGKVRHAFPMFSLQKHYEDQGESPLAHTATARAVSPKLDGASLCLLYVDGELTQAATRGDGVEGVDITDKIIGSNLVPKRIKLLGVVQVTGEVVAPSHIENARNYAAGSLNLKSVDEFKTRAVDFFAYGLQPSLSTTYRKDMAILEGEGFSTIFAQDIDKIYPCDGVVHRIDDNNTFYSMGFTANFPRGAYALKVRQEAVETKILSVEWQVNRTGRVTPVAILEPVMIGDAQVSRATLNNPGFIEMLGIEIGDTVAIVRAGMIIPQILYKVEP